MSWNATSSSPSTSPTYTPTTTDPQEQPAAHHESTTAIDKRIVEEVIHHQIIGNWQLAIGNGIG
jgi:hypothetical protein